MNEINYAEGINVSSIEDALRHFQEATNLKHEKGRISFKVSGKDVDLIWDTNELPTPKETLNFNVKADSLEQAVEILKHQLDGPRISGRFAGCISFDLKVASGEICWDIEW